jgi:multiple sugar transport system permease protein
MRTTAKGAFGSRPALYAALAASSLVMLFPFYWTLASSFKVESAILSSPPQWWPSPFVFRNYPSLFKHMPNFGRFFANSVFVAAAVTSGQVFFSTLAGYAFAKLRFPGRDAIFFVLLLGLMVPFQVNLIPMYKMMSVLSWIDSYQALILPDLLSIMNVFLMRQYMISVPDELFAAARIDGCGEFGVFWRIAFPLAIPGTATIVIFAFMNSWNSFLWPRIIIDSESLFTLPIGLTQLQLKNTINNGEILAGTTLVALPMILVYLAMQRKFIEGMTAGAVKG